MGFDLGGIKPRINVKIDQFENYHAIEQLGYKERWEILDHLTDEERSKYYNEMDSFYEANPGIYFRNNVWWWRPLWAYVIEICHEIMTDDDIGGGSYNDGYIIKAAKAKKMAKLLEESIKDGRCERHAFDVKEHNKKLSESDDKDDRFMSSYPFDVDNVKRFIKFLRESGGFDIC